MGDQHDADPPLALVHEVAHQLAPPVLARPPSGRDLLSLVYHYEHPEARVASRPGELGLNRG